MIKQAIVCVVSLFLPFIGFSQQVNIDNLMIDRVPTYEDIAYNCTRLIMKYHEKNDTDSLKIVLSYWEQKNGSSEPLVRTKILLAIQDKQFDESLYNESILYYVINYEDRVTAEYPEQLYSYYKGYLGFVPPRSDFDMFTLQLAASLLPKQSNGSLEQLFCEFYSSEKPDLFSKLQQGNTYNGTAVKAYYDKEVSKQLKEVDYNYSGVAGIWIPQSKLSVLGNHPLLGFQAGLRYGKMTYNALIYVSFLRAANSYQVLQDEELVTSKHFTGLYVGLGVERELLRKRIHQLDVLAGIGYDRFDAIEGDKKNDKDKKTIGTLSISMGLGYKYNFRNGGYLGLQGRYNLVNYKNSGGTNLSGNTITVGLLVGWLGNKSKQESLKTIKYQRR